MWDYIPLPPSREYVHDCNHPQQEDNFPQILSNSFTHDPLVLDVSITRKVIHYPFSLGPSYSEYLYQSPYCFIHTKESKPSLSGLDSSVKRSMPNNSLINLLCIFSSTIMSSSPIHHTRVTFINFPHYLTHHHAVASWDTNYLTCGYTTLGNFFHTRLKHFSSW